MSRSKHGKPSEHFLGEIRALRAENRRLLKLLREQEKNLMNPVEMLDEMLEQEIENKKLCPKCKATIIISNLGIKWLEACSSCQYRKTTPK